MTLRGTFAYVVLAHGLTCGWGHALAQGVNRRYDVLGQGLQENGWAIERTGENYLVIGTTPVITSENVYINPIVYSLLLNGECGVIASDTIVYEGHAIFPGMWNCMAPRRSGGFVSGGGTFTDDWIQRHALWGLDPDGVISFMAEIGPLDGECFSRQAIECKNGDFLLVGETDSNGGIDASLVRTDSTGAVLWSRTYGGPNFDFGWSVDTAMDDGFFLGGQYGYMQNVQLGKQWVIRVDAEGDTLWQKVWSDGIGHQSARLTTKANGNPVIAGTTTLVAGEDRFCYMAELAEVDGVLLWERYYGNNGFDMVLHIAKEVAAGGGHVAVGNVVDNQLGHDKGVMLRTADNGDSLWMRTFVYQDTVMSNGKGFLYDVVPTLDGGFIACGPAYGEPGVPYPPGYSQDLWIVKVDSLGCIIPGCAGSTGITTQITNMGYALSVYPNPVRDQLHVAIKLPANFKAEGPLVLTVVSMAGKLVRQETVPTSAPSEVMLDVTGLAAGTYTLHLTDAQTWIAGKKFVVE